MILDSGLLFWATLYLQTPFHAPGNRKIHQNQSYALTLLVYACFKQLCPVLCLPNSSLTYDFWGFFRSRRHGEWRPTFNPQALHVKVNRSVTGGQERREGGTHRFVLSWSSALCVNTQTRCRSSVSFWRETCVSKSCRHQPRKNDSDALK